MYNLSRFKTDLYLAFSIFASWAGPGSLVFGPAVFSQRGMTAFMIWALADSLCILLFGWLYKKELIRESLLDNKAFGTLLSLIQLICVTHQLKGMQTALLPFFDPVTAYLVTSGIGLAFVFWMWPKGLDTSIHTDNYQGIMVLLGLAIIICIQLCTGQTKVVPPETTMSDIAFISFSASAIVGGIITDVQHWERGKRNGKDGHAFEIATVLMMLYLALVYFYGTMSMNSMASLVLVVVILAAATSTIDSAACAMQRICGRNLGTIICAFFCCAWGICLSEGYVEVWTKLNSYRLFLAIIVLYVGIKWWYDNKKALKQ